MNNYKVYHSENKIAEVMASSYAQAIELVTKKPSYIKGTGKNTYGYFKMDFKNKVYAIKSGSYATASKVPKIFKVYGILS